MKARSPVTDNLSAGPAPRLAPTLPVLLIKASTWFHTGLQANLENRGLMTTTRGQGHVIANVAAGEHRASRIAQNLGISAQAASQLLADMEAKGILVVSKDPTDKRARIVEFNPAWEGYHLIAREILHGLEAHLERQFGKPLIDVMRLVLNGEWGNAPIVEPREPAAPSKRAKKPRRNRRGE